MLVKVTLLPEMVSTRRASVLSPCIRITEPPTLIQAGTASRSTCCVPASNGVVVTTLRVMSGTMNVFFSQAAIRRSNRRNLSPVASATNANFLRGDVRKARRCSLPERVVKMSVRYSCVMS
ncbi:hypothetical protein D3C71_1208110 [compost metagenome]